MSERKLTRTDAMPGRAGMYQYGPRGRMGASIWISGPSGNHCWATVKFRNQEKDFTNTSIEKVLADAMTWIDLAPELKR